MTSAAQETLTHRLTHRDLDYTPDDGNLYEIIDGELYVSPFPTFLHQRVVSRLTRGVTNALLGGGVAGAVLKASARFGAGQEAPTCKSAAHFPGHAPGTAVQCVSAAQSSPMKQSPDAGTLPERAARHGSARSRSTNCGQVWAAIRSRQALALTGS